MKTLIDIKSTILKRKGPKNRHLFFPTEVPLFFEKGTNEPVLKFLREFL